MAANSTCGWLGRHGDVGDAHVGALIEHALPVIAAVGGLVDAALVVGPVGVAQHADVQGLCIRRVNENAADLARIVEADVLPGCSSVVAAIHAVAGGEIGADVGLACAHVDHLGIGRRDGKRADGGDGLVIEDGLPHRAGVGRLPHAAVDAAEEEALSLPGTPLTATTRPARNGPTSRQRSPLNRARRELLRDAGNRDGGAAKRKAIDREKRAQTSGREAAAMKSS